MKNDQALHSSKEKLRDAQKGRLNELVGNMPDPAKGWSMRSPALVQLHFTRVCSHEMLDRVVYLPPL